MHSACHSFRMDRLLAHQPWRPGGLRLSTTAGTTDKRAWQLLASRLVHQAGVWRPTAHDEDGFWVWVVQQRRVHQAFMVHVLICLCTLQLAVQKQHLSYDTS